MTDTQNINTTVETKTVEVRGVAARWFHPVPQVDSLGQPKLNGFGQVIVNDVPHQAKMGEIVDIPVNQVQALLDEGIVQEPGAALLVNHPNYKPGATHFSRPMGNLDEAPSVEEPVRTGPGGITAEAHAEIEAARRLLDEELSGGPVDLGGGEDDDEAGEYDWVASNTIKDVLAYVEENPDEAGAVLQAELERETPRSSLIAKLNEFGSDETDESVEEDESEADEDDFTENDEADE
jgi:hypothetical protein